MKDRSPDSDIDILCLSFFLVLPSISMEQHVELVVLQTETAVDEQDDAQIEELLSSFYFDNSVTRQSTGEGSRHGEHLHPIYEEQEEDGIFYDLYGTVEEESPCSICESSDEENDSEISSQYGPKELPPNIAQNPSSFWPTGSEHDRREEWIDDQKTERYFFEKEESFSLS
ncbi:hypothetical protein LENED_000858 [Lentinula edodes]|uniref:Uncharacterized protein n=1 Tax=Lentinula edodes TaxID=5353 RepID=A0A1Q3DWM5_LENED|nr:hypothetical protein LENED_000858 [Lentinula edodes]